MYILYVYSFCFYNIYRFYFVVIYIYEKVVGENFCR